MPDLAENKSLLSIWRKAVTHVPQGEVHFTQYMAPQTETAFLLARSLGW
jgi:hypothetical protein